MDSAPQISIVMPSFNQRRYVAEAVSSVLDQVGVQVELCVLDPGSTDGSREELLRLKEKYGVALKLVFEPDAGQSDAVNKGLALARAPILGWLNSDDRLLPGTLKKVVQRLSTHEPAWLYGQAVVINEHGERVSGLVTAYKNLRGRTFSRFKLLQENFISQMSVFWTSAMWQRSGPLDLAKHLDMDYDLWLRFAKIVDPIVLREPLAEFRVHAEAKGSTQTGPQLQAAYATAREHAGDMGVRGNAALLLHRVLSARTQLVYKFTKP